MTMQDVIDVLCDLENRLYFSCKFGAEECYGSCSKCSDFAVSKEDFDESRKMVIEKYRSVEVDK